MTARTSSAQRKKRDDGVRWHVIRADLKNFFGRLPEMFRNDYTAVMLVVANIYPVIEMAFKGEPVGSLLVVYWIQLMIIGFWNAVKLVVIARWKALLFVPIFAVMYLSIINMFGIVAGALLEDQMRGTPWHQSFSMWTYWVPAVVFFASHGLSFWVNFVKGREFETIDWETQLGKPFLRVMPMWIAALAGGILGGILNSAAWALLLVLPVKLSLDVFGHFAEHGMLSFDEDPRKPLWREP